MDGSGALWLNAEREGLFHWKNGVWRRLEIAPEVAHLNPSTAFTDSMGRAWFGYFGGTILLVNDETLQRVFPAGKSEVGSVIAINGRGPHLWVAGQLGMAYFDGNRFRRIAPTDAETFGAALAVEETSNGDLWLAENKRVIEIAATEIGRVMGDLSYLVKYRSFNSFDGLPGSLASISRSHVTRGTDGRLWFLASEGLAWIDPANILTNTLPPPVSIRSVEANGRTSESLTNIVLPPRTTDLNIEYTALSLSAPAKVRFRYKLEGVDKDWHDAGGRREAFYNRLGRGNTVFK